MAAWPTESMQSFTSSAVYADRVVIISMVYGALCSNRGRSLPRAARGDNLGLINIRPLIGSPNYA